MNQDSNRTESAEDVVSAYRRFRSADAARQARVRETTGLGDNELRVLQFLLRAQREDRDVMPSEIARHIGISSASTTALLDRLARGGSLERVNHPTDRRSILITLTPAAERLVTDTVEIVERRLHDVAAALDDGARVHVARFFDALTAASDAIAVPAAAS